MRVLHVIQSLEFGGAEKVVVDLANATLSLGDVGICCVNRRGALAIQVDPRIPVMCLDMGEGNDWRLPSRLASIMRQGHYDIVHSHSWNVYLETALATLLAGSPRLVHTIHGNYMRYAPGLTSRLKVGLRHALERLLVGRHHRIVSVSDSIRSYALRDVGLPPDRVTTIHNGIACKNEHGCGSDGRSFVAVGRLAEVKNHGLMIRAFGGVLTKYPDARLQIAGDGPEREKLEALVTQLGIGGSVRFLGFLQDVTGILSESDVFVMSSRYEGVSIAVLEAMCAGLPILATNVGGIPETVIDGVTGVLVPDDDIGAMTAGMLRLLESADDRKRFGTAGKEYLHREFSMEKVLERYSRFYLGLT